jgi:two-component system, OmpR family, osmolarity sensor histidine kinase EnvZ
VRPWFSSLFVRMVLVNGAVALLVTSLFAVFAVRQHAQTSARAIAPIWAAALTSALSSAATLPRQEVVSTPVALLAGPPPPEAVVLAFNPRLRALVAELRAEGVPVRGLKVSGRTGEAITWLEIGQGDAGRWVGVRGEFEGIDFRERGTVGILIGVAATLAAAWWLSRRILRPVTDLRLAMQRFETQGLVPPPAAENAPTELRALSQQFAELARQRSELDEQRRTMLAAISHDLRSPLGRIRMAAELLPDGEDVARRREAIVRNVQVADRLLGSFIDMARADDEPIAQRVDLCALIRELSQDAADVTTAPLPESPLWLQPASALALERAVCNLLDNARHHGAAPIELSLRREGTELIVSVRDHGPGMAAADRTGMLKPFVRGESSRSSPGTGLGLAIVQRTAQRHGGRLMLSDAAPGLRADIRLPWAATQSRTSVG